MCSGQIKSDVYPECTASEKLTDHCQAQQWRADDLDLEVVELELLCEQDVLESNTKPSV